MVPKNSPPEPGRVIRSIDPKLYYRYSSFVPATASELCPRIRLKRGDSCTNQPPVYGLSRERPNRRLPGTCKGFEGGRSPAGRAVWPAAGLVDTELGCFRKPEGRDAEETEVKPRTQTLGGEAGQGARGIGGAGCPSWPFTDEARATGSHIRPLWYDVIRVVLLPRCYPSGRIGADWVTRLLLSICKVWLRG